MGAGDTQGLPCSTAASDCVREEQARMKTPISAENNLAPVSSLSLRHI